MEKRSLVLGSLAVSIVAGASFGGYALSRVGVPDGPRAVGVNATPSPGALALHPPGRDRSNEPPGPFGSERADGGSDDDDRAYDFRLPSGRPTALSCEDARHIVEQVRQGLAYEPDKIAPAAFADATSDWLDPHGLWSLPEDAPALAALHDQAPTLLHELEGTRSCDAAAKVGAALAGWVGDLRGEFERARDAAMASAKDANGTSSAVGSASVARDPLPAIDTSAGGGRALARELGQRIGRWTSAAGPDALIFARSAEDRFFPTLDAAGWSRVVLAAAVRAYVPLVDPHGAWAPFDEESSVYEVDLASQPPSRLWSRPQPTAVGIRLLEGAESPLEDGDVVLALADVPTAGLPLEQIDQLGFAAADAPTGTTAMILRGDDPAPRLLTIPPPAEDDGGNPAPAASTLTVERVHLGDGEGLVIAIPDVRDDLGDELTQVIERERRTGPEPTAVLLDLRGNGGGSTDGAMDAIGIFLPGVPLFPMKRRDGTLETDRAPEPPRPQRWTGPVATLVDAATASAAEMISGALSSYRRGPSVGETTYGKGCAQEYLNDDAHAGVLRLTTLLYALPDGTPVQRIGLAPTLRIPLVGKPVTDDDDREATLPHAPPTWRGPDVRPATASSETYASWPGVPAAAIGPCKDADVCRALRALAGSGTKRVSSKAK
jgi:carboxyl-terminal processing protease